MLNGFIGSRFVSGTKNLCRTGNDEMIEDKEKRDTEKKMKKMMWHFIVSANNVSPLRTAQNGVRGNRVWTGLGNSVVRCINIEKTVIIHRGSTER